MWGSPRRLQNEELQKLIQNIWSERGVFIYIIFIFMSTVVLYILYCIYSKVRSLHGSTTYIVHIFGEFITLRVFYIYHFITV